MKRWLFALAFVLLPHILWAQPIHGHPQKAAYMSASEYPNLSCQTHWAPGENPVVPPADAPTVDLATGKFGNSTISHAVHLDLKAPIYREVTGPITFAGTLMQFHFAGVSVIDPSRFELYRDIVWDETGTSTPPDLHGNPTGLTMHGFHITMDPTLPIGGHAAPAHGWFVAELQAMSFFDNGDSVITGNMPPFYSMLDPNADERSSYPLVDCRSYAASSRRPDHAWGITFTETGQYLPLAPISVPWTNIWSSAGYGGSNPEAASLDQRADLDLHSGNSGRVIYHLQRAGDIFEAVTIDPAVLGNGPHKVATIRTQPDGPEMVATLAVITITVDPNAPPVECCAVAPPPPVVTSTCQDPGATNIGGPLPCVFTPPPPPPAETFSLATTELSNLGRVRVCVAGVCVFVPILP